MKQEFLKGLIKENPIFVVMLGLCPTLATSVSLKNAIGMGLAATFVLIASNAIISAFGRFFPSQIRIPCYIVVIATFVSIVEMVMGAYLPKLNEALGIFIPLIVVNCIILGRAEAFACKNKVLPSIFDALGMGFGFGLALVVISFIRELLGTGKFLGISITSFFAPGEAVEPMAVMIMAPGAFIVIALLMASLHKYKHRSKSS